MWSRISKLNISKTKIRDQEDGPESSEQQVNTVLPEAPPNLSMFRSTPNNNKSRSSVSLDIAVNDASTTPTPTESKSGLKNIFRRSKVISPVPPSEEASSSNTSKRKSILGFPGGQSNSENNFGKPQIKVDTDQSLGTPPQGLLPRTPKGSVRSILRTPDTPATGQSVRFFSRDAYRIITPDNSMDAAPVPITAALSTSPDHPPPTTLSDVTNSRPSDADMFSPPRKTSSPIPKGDISQSLSLASIPGDISNLFNMSHDLDAIPQDGSVLELSAENELMYSDGSQSRGSVIFPSADSRNVSKHKRPDSTATITNANFYHTPQRTLQPLYAHSEASPSSIDNLSVPSSSSTMMENTTYHTPQTTARHASVSPSTTPLAAVASTTIYHTPLTSPEHRLPPLEFPETSSLLATLQAKLELQQDISMQYEADLSARDELVEVLQYKTDSAERTSEAWKAEGERRERKVERMRKRCKEWEAQCAWLTEQLERSREESFERSIFDEASGEALRMLHINIKNLEAAKANLESQARDLEVKIQGEIEAKSAAEAIVESLRKEIGAREKEVMDMKDREVRGSDDVVQLRNDVRAWRETAERLEREGIQAAEEMEHFKRTIELTQNNSSVENGIESLKEEIIRREQEYADLREGHRSAEFAWAEERVALLQAKEDALRRVAQLETENEELNGKDEELMMIKDELEAQWEHAEKASAEIKGLKNDIAQLRDTLEEVKAEKAELEGELYRRGEAEEEKENIMAELRAERESRDQLHEELTQLDQQYSQLQNEHEAVLATEARLNDDLTKRDEEIRELEEQVDNQTRRLSEARLDLEKSIKEREEDDDQREDMSRLKEEIEKLMRQVHDLRSESADKEVKIVELKKTRAQDKEDKEGLNIALDSKQQELELLKRKLGVRGTAGSTPAAPSRIQRLSDFNLRQLNLDTPGTNTTIGTEAPASVLPRTLKERRPSASVDTPLPAALRSSLQATTNGVAPLLAKQPSTKTLIRPGSRSSMVTPTAAKPLQRVPSATGARLTSSVTAKPAASTVTGHRRASSSISSLGGVVKVAGRISHSPGPSLDESVEGEQESEILDKENRAPSTTSKKSTIPTIPRRRTLIPAS